MAEQKTQPKPVAIHILDKDYLIACPPEERDELLAAAKYLDRKMREIRDAGRVVGTDRIAVMAALNIAHELLTKPGGEHADPALGVRIKSLQERIEDALHKTRQLEL